MSRYQNDVVPVIRQRCVPETAFASNFTSVKHPHGVDELAKRKGVSMAQVSLAWLLSKPGVTAPIVGSTSLANLEDILGALEVKLTQDEVEFLEEAYRPLPISDHV